jgi:hypothetical protein
MWQYEAELAAHAELQQRAAAIDRILGEVKNRELVRRLSALRRKQDGVLALLADRTAESPKTQRQLIYERQCPWDRL